MTMPETRLVERMIDLIRARPDGYARKVHASRYGNFGEPDIDACVSGFAVKIEAKRPGEQPGPAQFGALRRWQKAGALVGWATSIQHVEQILARVGDPTYRPDLSTPGAPPR
jgi:hypothetical protein